MAMRMHLPVPINVCKNVSSESPLNFGFLCNGINPSPQRTSPNSAAIRLP